MNLKISNATVYIFADYYLHRNAILERLMLVFTCEVNVYVESG